MLLASHCIGQQPEFDRAPDVAACGLSADVEVLAHPLCRMGIAGEPRLPNDARDHRELAGVDRIGPLRALRRRQSGCDLGGRRRMHEIRYRALTVVPAIFGQLRDCRRDSPDETFHWYLPKGFRRQARALCRAADRDCFARGSSPSLRRDLELNGEGVTLEAPGVPGWHLDTRRELHPSLVSSPSRNKAKFVVLRADHATPYRFIRHAPDTPRHILSELYHALTEQTPAEESMNATDPQTTEETKTITVEDAAKILGISRGLAYEAEGRWRASISTPFGTASTVPSGSTHSPMRRPRRAAICRDPAVM